MPHTTLGVAEARVGELAAAEKALRIAVAIDPQNGDANYNLGEVLLLRGAAPGTAEPFLRRAYEAEPTNEQFADGMVRLCEKTDDHNKAAEVYLTVVRLDESNARAHYKAAVLLDRAGRREQAITYLHRGLSLAGDSQDAWVSDAKKLLNAWQEPQ